MERPRQRGRPGRQTITMLDRWRDGTAILTRERDIMERSRYQDNFLDKDNYEKIVFLEIYNRMII